MMPIMGERERLADSIKRQLGDKLSSNPPARTHSISFAPALLLAVIEGRKTQTRRPIRGNAESPPSISPNDRLIVLEKWGRDPTTGDVVIARESSRPLAWKAGRFMPRAAAKVVLRVKSVRRERLNDISEADACAEGFSSTPGTNAVEQFRAVWDSIYDSRGLGWRANPAVWVIDFELERK